MAEEETAAAGEAFRNGDGASLNKEAVGREKRKRRLLKEAENAEKRGVCYLSRVPPRMDPLKLRQLLSAYGEIGRVYLTPEGQPLLFFSKRSRDCSSVNSSCMIA